MDFLNKAYGQVSDLFKSMTPGSRITAGMLLIVICVSLFYLFAFQINSASEYLYGGREFSQAELANMQSAFADANLNQFEVVGNRMRVPGRKMVSYLQALSQNNVTLEDFDSPIDEAIASANSFIDSKQLQDYRFTQAAQKKLGHWIRGLSGINNATVHFQEVKKPGFPPQVERTATIAVEAVGSRPLNRELVRTIRTTASGFFGIRPEDVTVTDLNGNKAWGGTPESRDEGWAEMVYADTKRYLEDYWQRKIYDCLSVYPGVVVGVNVELDSDLASETKKVTVDPQPTAVESNTYRKTAESKPAVGGRPGAVPNEVPSNAPRDIASVTNQETTLDENREKQVSVAGHEETIRKKAPLIPKFVTATVWIPKSYFRTLWHQQHPTPAGTEPKVLDDAELVQIENDVTKKISDSIVHTLPRPEVGDSPYPQVHVTSYDDIPTIPLESPSLSSTALAWLSINWRSIGLLLLGLASLVMLRGMIRAATSKAVTPAVSLPQLMPTEEPAEEESAEQPIVLQRRVASTGASLRDELTAMVREDPDAAANVLRTWIGDAA